VPESRKPAVAGFRVDAPGRIRTCDLSLRRTSLPHASNRPVPRCGAVCAVLGRAADTGGLGAIRGDLGTSWRSCAQSRRRASSRGRGRGRGGARRRSAGACRAALYGGARDRRSAYGRGRAGGSATLAEPCASRITVQPGSASSANSGGGMSISPRAGCGSARRRPTPAYGPWICCREDVPFAVELGDGDPVSELSQAGEAATSGAAVVLGV
jgi:hypothetical protein